MESNTENNTDNWWIVSSHSGKDSDFGFPTPKILCRSEKDIKQAIKQLGGMDIMIERYRQEENE